MRYEKPGYGDPCTWGPAKGHPNDPRTDPDKVETRLEKLVFVFSERIRNHILDDDDTAIRVADQLIRYLTDVEVVDIVRDTMHGKKEAVFLGVRELIEEAIEGLAENRAISQLELDP